MLIDNILVIKIHQLRMFQKQCLLSLNKLHLMGFSLLNLLKKSNLVYINFFSLKKIKLNNTEE
jgi:hypothetical protein